MPRFFESGMNRGGSFITGLLLLAATAAQAQFDFATNDGALTVTNYTGGNGVVTIPATYNGLPVTSIGTNAFANCFSMISVTIPGTVTNIGSNAFANSVNLASVTIPDGVTSIGEYAF